MAAAPTFAEAVAGQYELVRELGRGGMGIVFLARELRLDRLVALKVLPPELALQNDLTARFLREATTAAQLSHPNIIPIYRADEAGGYAFFAMAYVDGETLAQQLAARGRLGPAEAVRLLREVAWALAYAHARGVVHRDIKPENVMIERGTGRVQVGDFGIARDERAPGLTQTGEMLGTAHYMSPEQINGDRVDGRSDLYALGVLGFRLLTGRLPFDGVAAPAVIVAHATKPAPPLAAVAPDVPAPLAKVIDRCLQKDPGARFATGEELADALTRALDAAPAPAADTPVPQVLSPEQAEAVWLRAAQLQMDAATRIRQRSKELRPGPGATGPGGDQPTSGYRLKDVEAAAAEVGIGSEFVQLALAELPAAGGTSSAVAPVVATPLEERVATLLLGTDQRSLRVARTFDAPPAKVLEALGRTVGAYPYELELLDTVGGHPLDGGVLLFRVPQYKLNQTDTTSSYGVNMFRYRMTQLELEALRMTVQPVPGRADRTEVAIYGDLRPGARKNVRASHWFAAGAGTLGSVGTFLVSIAPKALALSFGVAVLPAIGVFAAGGALSYGLYRMAYRSALKASDEALGRMLDAVGASMRSMEVFGAPPRPPRRPPEDDGGADVASTLLTSL